MYILALFPLAIGAVLILFRKPIAEFVYTIEHAPLKEKLGEDAEKPIIKKAFNYIVPAAGAFFIFIGCAVLLGSFTMSA